MRLVKRAKLFVFRGMTRVQGSAIRRAAVRGAGVASAAVRNGIRHGAPSRMTPSGAYRPGGSSWVDQIPLVWVTPEKPSSRLAVWLPAGLGTKEDTLPRLQELATAGFVAVSFDPWLHGERASGEPAEQFFDRAMANFPRIVWPIIGQSALDA